MSMDASVISIEELAKKFRQSLFQRGFSRASLSVLRPCQNSGLLTSDLAGLGLILAGDLMINLAEARVIYGAGDEFFIPAQTYYQATGGEFGTQFLFAKQRLGFD
jgi:hypothetical protein